MYKVVTTDLLRPTIPEVISLRTRYRVT